MNDYNTDVMTEQEFAIHHDLEISGPLNKVFDAVSNHKHLENWWPLRCTGKPEIGEEYNFYFTPEYDWYGEVVKVELNKSFYIKMIKADDDWSPTSFGFDLEMNGGMTIVRFHHVGWPSCNAHFRHSSFCWAMLLNGLKNYVEKGIIVPFEDRE